MLLIYFTYPFYTETYSEPCQTSKTEERFAKIITPKSRYLFHKTHHLRCLAEFWIRLCHTISAQQHLDYQSPKEMFITCEVCLVWHGFLPWNKKVALTALYKNSFHLWLFQGGGLYHVETNPLSITIVDSVMKE